MTTADYNQCVRDFSDGLYRYALKMVHRRMEAEDIVQLVFERLWKNHRNVEAAAAKAYLFKSIQRASIDLYRKQGTRDRAMDDLRTDNAVQPDRTFEHRQLIELALEELNARQKQMVLLRDYEGYPYKDIAKIMDLTEAQVKINLFRARKKMHFFLNRSEQLVNEV
ncbi:MAG: sigma-70 family RNA polymerase sigma factor [Saprospiraceae bacterium]|nr:sigma-70 family RNA polymerase sigma factor [Saprospiraceae bacterium]